MIPKPKDSRRKRHKMTIECDISPEVRKTVYERDSVDNCPVCIVCGNPHGLELAHFVPRSQGGKGIPENLGCMCKRHHLAYDLNGENAEFFEGYLRAHYPDWERGKVIFDRWALNK